MSTITIGALPLQGTVLDSTVFAVESGGITKRLTASALKTYVSVGTTSVTTTSATVSGTLNAGSITVGSLSVTGDDNVTGNVTAANLVTSGNVTTSYIIADGYFYSNGAPFIGGVPANGNITVLNIGGTITTNAQPNITSIGTLTGLNVSGSILPTSNNAIDIGSTTAWFNNFYGKSVQAKYADLAERYKSDKKYDPGTVLVFGVDTEVTISRYENDRKVIGVVTTNPAYLMNSEIDGVDVALQGRVPCRVQGPVSRGDMLVTSNLPGVAMVNNYPQPGTIIGKALETYDESNVCTIEVVVGRV